jgi:mono/diheme cytochrome c family protein
MQSGFILRFYYLRQSLLFTVSLLIFILIATASFGQQAPCVAPKTADNVKNPLSGNNSSLSEMRTLYVTNCSPCHGDKGRGDGPAAPGLNPKPADHTSAAIQSETDGAIFWKLSEGRNPMPGYKKIFSEEQRWQLVNYIRSLAKNTKKK